MTRQGGDEGRERAARHRGDLVELPVRLAERRPPPEGPGLATRVRIGRRAREEELAGEALGGDAGAGLGAELGVGGVALELSAA